MISAIDVLNEYADLMEKAREPLSRLCAELQKLLKDEKIAALTKNFISTEPKEEEDLFEIAIRAKKEGLSEDLIKELLNGLGERQSSIELLFEKLVPLLTSYFEARAKTATARAPDESYADIEGPEPVITPPPTEVSEDSF